MVLYFTNMHALLHMGGYASYVWSAYALVIIVLCINAWLTRRQFKRLICRPQTQEHA